MNRERAEQLLETAVQKQDEFWEAIRELEKELGKPVNGNVALSSFSIDDLLEDDELEDEDEDDPDLP